MSFDRKYEYFGHRYQIHDVAVNYQTVYEQVPFTYRDMDGPPEIYKKRVPMATITLPQDRLDDLVDDLEMQADEVRLRRNIPALHDMYQKYKMMVELYK